MRGKERRGGKRREGRGERQGSVNNRAGGKEAIA